jgi:signal peptidase II
MSLPISCPDRPVSPRLAITMPLANRPALVRFALMALLVAAVDLASKQAATLLVGPKAVVSVTEQLTLLLVYNTGNAGGGSMGPYTWHVNVAVTALALALMAAVVPHLAAVDRRATWALGTVGGGALGNLASLLFGPPGVADFLGFHLPGGSLLVANVADLALWLGAAALLPVAWTIVRVLRDDPRPLLQVPAPAPLQNPM